MRAPKRILISARILVGQTQEEIARACGLGTKTVHRAEMGIAGISTVETLMAFYERSGIRFIEPNDSEGWGVTASFLTLPYEQERQD